MSSGSGNVSSLVKLAGIEFPPLSQYGYSLVGEQCYEYGLSGIEVDSCRIDTVSRTIWVEVVQKTTYGDNTQLIVETGGLAVQNPSNNASVPVNSFTVRYYTWPDSLVVAPTITGGDDYCFLKQDATQLPSTTINYQTYSSSYYTPHTSVEVPERVYINEFEPAHYYVNNGSHLQKAKSPFSFTLLAPTIFAALSGSNYHSVSVAYSSHYTIPTLQQTSNDLTYYVPTCELNGLQMYQCSVSGGSITMQFQQALASGEEFAVRFSIVNPKDETD